jgi:hypothetical protein
MVYGKRIVVEVLVSHRLCIAEQIIVSYGLYWPIQSYIDAQSSSEAVFKFDPQRPITTGERRMPPIRSATAAVLLTFSTMQVAAQEPGVAQAGGAGAPVSGTAPNTVGTIQGNALTASNGQVADKVVRLRDAETGRVVGTQSTGNTGAFSFTGVEPGNYLVEVIGANESVVGASSIVALHAGEIVTTAVKLPLLTGGILGGTAAMATIVAASAAAAGVLAVNTVGDPTCPQ